MQKIGRGNDLKSVAPVPYFPILVSFQTTEWRKQMKASSKAVGIGIIVGATSLIANVSANDAADFLIPRIAVGEHVSNVFSVAASVKAAGFDELVGRNSGSADYTLTKSSPDHGLTFDAHDIYDGSPADHAENIVRDGGATSCWDGQCRTYTDASGPVYNRLLWGDPPAQPKAGMTWTVTIPQPWELGPAGTQTVTVEHVDRTDGSVTLKREGTATGFFAGESHQVTLTKNGTKVTLDVTPGQAHWSGYTTFRQGIVLSDELLVVRTDKLHSKSTGTVDATRRRYMLLNAAPYPTM